MHWIAYACVGSTNHWHSVLTAFFQPKTAWSETTLSTTPSLLSCKCAPLVVPLLYALCGSLLVVPLGPSCKCIMRFAACGPSGIRIVWFAACGPRSSADTQSRPVSVCLGHKIVSLASCVLKHLQHASSDSLKIRMSLAACMCAADISAVLLLYQSEALRVAHSLHACTSLFSLLFVCKCHLLLLVRTVFACFQHVCNLLCPISECKNFV